MDSELISTWPVSLHRTWLGWLSLSLLFSCHESVQNLGYSTLIKDCAWVAILHRAKIHVRIADALLANTPLAAPKCVCVCVCVCACVRVIVVVSKVCVCVCVYVCLRACERLRVYPHVTHCKKACSYTDTYNTSSIEK